jgi:hypothetical protein
LLVAAIFCAIAAWAAYTAVRWSLARSWPAVPCVITRSSAEETPTDSRYVFRATYRYTWAGRPYEGRTYREDYSGSYDIAEADRLARTFPVGSHGVCYVNPGNPSQALLEHDNVWIPVAAVVVMLHGGAAFVLAGRRGRAAIGSLVALMGLSCYVIGFAPALSRGLRSLGWRATPCLIESGQVRSARGLWHTNYWPDVIYRYEVDDAAYRANTINASDVGSPWYYGAKGVVRRHPPGMVMTCYVNPSDPSEAVLDQTLSGTQWFGIWPLVMIVMGVSLVISSVTGREIKVGTPRFWGTLALGAATTSAMTAFWITGADLFRDYRDGVAEWPEYEGVAIACMTSTVFMLAWVLLAANRRGRGAATTPLVVWDREMDRLAGGEGRPKALANKSSVPNGRTPGDERATGGAT